MTDTEIDEKARAWLRGYHGSVDTTALLLAYKAGRSEALDEAARVAERPIRGNGHSMEVRFLSQYAVETGRAIRDLKGPQYLPPRRLR